MGLSVSDAINDVVGGFSILEGNGRGSGERQTIRAGRGTGTMVAEYNKIAVVSTVVDDSEVEKISTAIAGAAFTGNRWRRNYRRNQCRKCSKYSI